MFKEKDNPTFKTHGFRRVRCPHCTKIVGKKGRDTVKTYLNQKTYQAFECCHCKGRFIVYPPARTVNTQNERIIKWGADLSCTTADLLDSDFIITEP